MIKFHFFIFFLNIGLKHLYIPLSLEIWGRNLSKRGLAVCVILLFIGVAFAPSINASVVKDELVEFDIEFCGLGRKNTVQLTQQEADEVEQLFDDIEQKLSEVDTREEAEIIFNNAIVELDKYGLIGGLSVRFAQNLVTGKFRNSFKNNIQQESPTSVKDEIHNRFCLVLGTSLIFTVIQPSNILVPIIDDIYWYIYTKMHNHDLGLFFVLLSYTIFNIKPMHINCCISFGYERVIPGYGTSACPAIGAIFTIGLEGIKNIAGNFYGNLDKDTLDLTIGVKGFTGLRILNNYIGFASEVGLQRTP